MKMLSIALIMAGAALFYEGCNSYKVMTYHSTLGFSVETPTHATTSELFGPMLLSPTSPALGPIVTVKVALDADSQNVVLMNAYYSSSADDWLMKNVSIGFDNKGVPINNYQRRTINGNDARVLTTRGSAPHIAHAIIYHNSRVYVFNLNLRNPARYASSVDRIINSFKTDS
jgi:hypothetical protein